MNSERDIVQKRINSLKHKHQELIKNLSSFDKPLKNEELELFNQSKGMLSSLSKSFKKYEPILQTDTWQKEKEKEFDDIKNEMDTLFHHKKKDLTNEPSEAEKLRLLLLQEHNIPINTTADFISDNEEEEEEEIEQQVESNFNQLDSNHNRIEKLLQEAAYKASKLEQEQKKKKNR